MEAKSQENTLNLFKSIRRAAQVGINTLLDETDTSIGTNTIIISGILQEIIKSATSCLNNTKTSSNSPTPISDVQHCRESLNICLQEIESCKDTFKQIASKLPTSDQIQDFMKLSAKGSDTEKYVGLSEQINDIYFSLTDNINSL